MLVNITDQLNADSPASPISLTAATSTQLVGLDAGQASQDGVSSQIEHNGVVLTADPANTTPVYIALGTGAASATSWNLALNPGQTWAGSIGNVGWRGALQGWSSATAKVGVTVA